MSQNIKVILYVVFVVGACLFGYLAHQNYKLVMNAAPAPAQAASEPVKARQATPESKGYARMISYGVGLIGMVIGLGLLLGHDVSQMIGNRALKVLYDDEGEALVTPEYEIAEQQWADGNHLEAIRLMRDHLEKHPRQVHVALRIAEIYEKDLQNPVAAALEYEEVLKKKLPAERWGWAGIHLCNLYFRLNQPDKAVALLKRIDAEYGETAAAEKARKRLTEMDEPLAETRPVEEPQAPTQVEPPAKSNLPPGFRAKKV